MSEKETKAYEENNGQLGGPTEGEETNDITISLNAMCGNVGSSALRINGLINDKEVHILIDSGNTHCFINEKVVGVLKWRVEHTTPIVVRVAYGSKVLSSLDYPILCWEIRGHQFPYPVRVLKLGGCDFIMGCYWLSAKKWSKGKQKENVNNMVLFDKFSEASKFKLTTPSILSNRLRTTELQIGFV
ncbi:UNVERIFIED_CONTAM: 40S ribosomal protein S25-1 [Sesamum radiatum]|uniref:40S ribosomal protein S25-1 n=1 Tax=Sesamum radiatum TaxID=300843 RepID=A0AAW2TYN0_SESRA